MSILTAQLRSIARRIGREPVQIEDARVCDRAAAALELAESALGSPGAGEQIRRKALAALADSDCTDQPAPKEPVHGCEHRCGACGVTGCKDCKPEYVDDVPVAPREDSEGDEELTMIALALKNKGIEGWSPEEGVENLIVRYSNAVVERDSRLTKEQAAERVQGPGAAAVAIRAYEESSSVKCETRPMLDALAAVADAAFGEDSAHA